ncbi:hypothetical protein GCM10027202_10940 [Microvirgula curvata]
MQPGPADRQRDQPLAGTGIPFVGNVVGTARKAVNGVHGTADPARQQNGTYRKILVMSDAHCPVPSGLKAAKYSPASPAQDGNDGKVLTG